MQDMSSLNLSTFEQKFLLGVERIMRSVSGGELCMYAYHTNHWREIPAEMAMKSFKSCGISNALHETEDNEL